MAKAKQAKAKSMKLGSKVKVDNMRISKEHPCASVNFKVTKANKMTGAVTVRAKTRGLPAVFVKVDPETGKAKAGVRGEAPVAARTADQAFKRAVKRDWA